MKRFAIICFAVLMIGCAQSRDGPRYSLASRQTDTTMIYDNTFLQEPYHHPRRVKHKTHHQSVSHWRPTDWLNWLAAGERPKLD